MAKTYRIAQTLRKSLLDEMTKLNDLSEEYHHGLIGGYSSPNDDNQINCVISSTKQCYLTAGLTAVGVYYLKPDEADAALVSYAIRTLNRKTGKLLLIGPSDRSDLFNIREIDLKQQSIIDEALVEFIEDQNELMDELIIVRVKGLLPITIPGATSNQQLKKSVNGAFKNRSDSLKKVAFQLNQSNYVIDGSNSAKDVLSDLYSHIEDSEYHEIEDVNASGDLKAKMFEKLFKKRLAEKQPILLTFNLAEDERLSSDTKFEVNFEEKTDIKTNLAIDLVLGCAASSPLRSLPKTLIGYVQRQLEAMKDCVQFFIDQDAKFLYTPKAYHCWPKSKCPVFLSPTYPISLNDSELTEYRSKLHQSLLLPTDRPYIRKANRYRFPDDEDSNQAKYLINPHIGLKPSGLKSGKVSLVDGYYSYHHYMQDGINDNGWGCAYRSLQTIVSWFMHQGYIDIQKVPSHKKIQETLVECGDKEPSFIGTSKWIGSQEVNYVLNQLYGITSKIMFVSSGRELSSKGSELRHHFETQGTPIMIGGGVLAHTIIGIDFDDNSGDINFLVLDPHYTGSEDLSTIQRKGWCGWKPPKFWDPSSFYNLCLPQRPSGF